MKLYFLLISSLLFCVEGGFTQEFKDFAVGENPELTLTNFTGDITLKAGPSGKITIHYRKHNNVEIDMKQSSDRVSVSTKTAGGAYHRQGDVSFEVTFPNTGGSVDIETVAGNLSLEGVSGRIELATISGDIFVKDAKGRFDLSTMSGDIDLANIQATDLNAGVVSGDIQMATAQLESGNYALSSTSGNLRVVHGKTASYRISGNSVSGRIQVPAGVSSIKVLEDRYSKMQSLDGSIGDGKGRLELNTVSGNITLTIKD